MERIISYIDFLIPKELKQEEALYKARFFVSFLLLAGILVVLTHFFIYIGEFKNTFNFFIGYAYSITPFVLIWLRKELLTAGNWFLFLVALNLNFSLIELGGILSPILLWLALLPIIALLIMGPKSSIVWLCIIAFNLLGIYATTNLESFQLLSPEVLLYNSLSVLVIFAVIVFLFWNAQDRLVKELISHQEKMEESQRALKKNNKELDLAHKALGVSNRRLANQNNHLEQVKLDLVESNEGLERYAHTVSHDLREPLRSVSSFVQLLHRHYDGQNLLDDRSREYFDFVFKGTDNMNQLISEMLKFSEFSKSGQNDFKQVDLNGVLEIAKSNLIQQIKENEVEIISEGLPIISGLPIPIIQLFQNIISNAIKFQQKEVKPIIKIEGRILEAKCLISIRDNGIGIKAEDCSKIFKEFGKVHKNKEFDGHGIGLATCQKIVKLHDGEIWVKSDFGKGTTFSFTLPAFVTETLETNQTVLETVSSS